MKFMQGIFGLVLLAQVLPILAVQDSNVALPNEKSELFPRPVDGETQESAALTARIVNESAISIANKIRRLIVVPSNVADDARVEFAVTMSPDGLIQNLRLISSSGNAAYDNAVKRAILKAQPLPVPQEAALFNKFREMRLTFMPKG